MILCINNVLTLLSLSKIRNKLCSWHHLLLHRLFLSYLTFREIHRGYIRLIHFLFLLLLLRIFLLYWIFSLHLRSRFVYSLGRYSSLLLLLFLFLSSLLQRLFRIQSLHNIIVRYCDAFKLRLIETKKNFKSTVPMRLKFN